MQTENVRNSNAIYEFIAFGFWAATNILNILIRLISVVGASGDCRAKSLNYVLGTREVWCVCVRYMEDCWCPLPAP